MAGEYCFFAIKGSNIIITNFYGWMNKGEKMKRASTMEVKRQNRNNVYRIIYQKGKISKQEIANKI